MSSIMRLKRTILLTLICTSSVLIAQNTDSKENGFDPATVLWYDKPASMWEEALPVGNGRIGAMVYGKSGEEKIQFNEETYWSGGPYSQVVKGGYKKLPEIQKYIFNGEPIKAHKLFGRALMGYPVEQQKYQSLANLHLFFGQDSVDNYRRSLDLKTGVVTVEYTYGGVNYTKEVFASAVDQTIAIRITADKPGSINFDAELRGVRNSAHSNYATDYFRMDGLGKDQLKLTGKSADYMGVEGKLRYEARIKAVPEGGTMSIDGTMLSIKNADAATLYFVAATNFVNYKDVSADENKRVEDMLAKVQQSSFDAIKKSALADYKEYFDRVSLTLPTTDNSFLPTDKRMVEIQSSPDPQLSTLCYNFGRYLLISSSRPGTQPANLQGIWNNDMNPAWDSKYTTNINTEMNYWAVESANLSELSEPLTTMVKELTDQGAKVAKEHYGADGWVFHQNTDLWRVAAPMDGPTWGTFTVGGAWLTTHLWEHYLFTQDKEYLKDIYPVMKGSVEFFMDFLVEYPGTDWLVTNPSNSPENPPEGKGYKYFYDEITGMYYFTTIVAGSTIDMQILKDLFSYYDSASEILDVDPELRKQVSIARSRLVPSQIGKDGTLQEWTEDYGQMEKNHRHASHLYGLFPGNVISVTRTPELIEPVKKTLELRGDGASGWSRAWKTCLWARLRDGDRANSIFKGYLKEQAYSSLFAICARQFQVDGTLGMTAGISEMLIQSQEGYLDLLPALPSEWADGQFSGVCARGGFELDFSWKDKQITSLEILSKAGTTCSLKAGSKVKVFSDGKQIKTKKRKNQIVEFNTEQGKTYSVQGI
ncbi:glycoside hydrolase family 95 protein [Zobellia galactanivorans]|uniref:Alpha-L-fucosidase, family GH95 n=1 Tax=Zobellia galactanivorans (strain DSM 12802 / CCUG 47099 / CIP 106680 / NCIMB 13871 / Dsij) TaxID=63186 RepID=G0L8M2_ZOBGA|nr:glycoside hydrolase family 95 protein [Zobellia galactanivorans]CAZ97678.1 Alpha-L-fucosidase, family GH95 [Zobellia galactanivorans]